MKIVAADPDLTASAKLVAWYLTTLTNREIFDEHCILQAWPSAETMTEALGLRKQTIIDAYRLLSVRRYIAVYLSGKKGRGSHNTYRLLSPFIQKGTETVPFSDGKGTKTVPFPDGDDDELERFVEETVRWTAEKIRFAQETVRFMEKRVRSAEAKRYGSRDGKGTETVPETLNRSSDSRNTDTTIDTTSEINSSIKVNARENFENSPHPWDKYHCKECPSPKGYCRYSEGCYRLKANP